jgi:8-oxo-dGTP pyrophosphatase MutT (NUDIX family)
LFNETAEGAAKREAKEEAGIALTNMIFLGNIAPDSGILGTIIPVYAGTVTASDAAEPEESEAIAGRVIVTFDQLQQGLIDGFLTVPINGVQTQVPLRDGFLTFALLQAQARRLL